MGVPNATQVWQVADMYNNGVWHINWVLAKLRLIDMKKDNSRVPKAQRDKIVPTDIVILSNMCFRVSQMNFPENIKTIARSGIKPYTQILLAHPDVVKHSQKKKDDLAANTNTGVSWKKNCAEVVKAAEAEKAALMARIRELEAQAAAAPPAAPAAPATGAAP